MKLITFKPENCRVAKSPSGAAKLSIDTKVGSFRFNKRAIDLLGLANGDKVAFHQEGVEEGREPSQDWYVEKVEDGFPLRANKNGDCLIFSNVNVARSLFDSLGKKDRSGQLLIAGQPTKLLSEDEETDEKTEHILYGLLNRP